MYECARFPSECLIVSLVYIERLVATSEVPILCTSWRPILLAGLILAQKVWDDRSLHNVDFSFFCPMFTLKEINHLEKKFLELIDYDVSVSSSLCAAPRRAAQFFGAILPRNFSARILRVVRPRYSPHRAGTTASRSRSC